MASSSKSEQQSTDWPVLSEIDIFKKLYEKAINEGKHLIEETMKHLSSWKEVEEYILWFENVAMSGYPSITDVDVPKFFQRYVKNLDKPVILLEEWRTTSWARRRGYKGIEYNVIDEFRSFLRDLKDKAVPGLPADIFPRFKDLYKAAKEGNWENASKFLEENPWGVRSPISHTGLRLLHVAAAAGHHEFFQKLLDCYEPKDLERIRNGKQCNALHTAAEHAKVEIARLLVEKNPDLTNQENIDKNIPIMFGATLDRPEKDAKELLFYLIKVTKDLSVQNNRQMDLLSQLTLIGFHDVTLQILEDHKGKFFPNVQEEDPRRIGTNLLTILASYRTMDFKSSSKLEFWENWMYKLVTADADELVYHNKGDEEAALDKKKPLESKASQNVDEWQHRCYTVRRWLKELVWKLSQTLAPRTSKKIKKLKRRHVQAQELVKFVCDQAKRLLYGNIIINKSYEFLNLAAEAGIVEIISPWVEEFPYLMSLFPKEIKTPLHVAVYYRQEKIYNIIVNASRIDINKLANTIVNWPTGKQSLLHLAALLPPSGRLQAIAGSTLQMQRELQWFQEVEQRVDPIVVKTIQEDSKTVREIFTEKHKVLVEKAEDWLKGTSNYCMVVTTLVATVVFAAAFQVPGGDDDKGLPRFAGDTKFTIFVVSDSLALFSSLTSLLMFLSILTSRYAEQDFGKKLPMKLVIGLLFLFIAMASMMIAFVASIWIVLVNKSLWASVLATIGAAIPVIAFIILQLPMFVKTCMNTFGQGIFGSHNSALALQLPKQMF